MDLVLALDAGTTGVRCVAFDPELNDVDVAYRPLACSFPAPGEVEQDPLEILASCSAVLGDVARRQRALGREVACVGVATQRETIVGFDRATGRPFAPAIVWQDRRTASRCNELEVAGHGPAVRDVTGLVLDPYFSATKIDWLVGRGLADTARETSFATVDAWLVWNLTGGVEGGRFVTDASNASRTSLMELATRRWSAPMCSLFGVDVASLPEIQASTGPFGEISASAVAELAGVSVTGVLGDQQAALFGQACFRPGLVKATYGTGAFVLANAGATTPDVVEGLLSTLAWDLADDGVTFALEGSTFVAGAAAEWMNDVGLTRDSHELDSLARSVSDSAGVSFVPALSGLGSPFWRPEARGAIVGLSRGVTRAHLARALVEALTFQVRAMTDAFGDGGVVVDELRADGGAATMDLLMQLQATSSRVEVVRGTSLEATARGAASVAGVGAGLWSLEQLSDRWREGARFRPGDPVALDASYAAWRRAVDRC